MSAFSHSILKRSYLGDKPFLSGNQGQAFQHSVSFPLEAGGLRYPWIDVASGDHCAERLRALPNRVFFLSTGRIRNTSVKMWVRSVKMQGFEGFQVCEGFEVCEVPSLCPHTWTSHGHVWCAAGLPLGTHLLPKVRRVMQVKGFKDFCRCSKN